MTAVLLSVLAIESGAPVALAEAPAPIQPRERLLDHTTGPLAVAHRACWGGAVPENSLAALDACVRLGADMAEIDIRASKDGELVIIHDDALDRTTDGSGPVASKTLSELIALRLKTGAGGPAAALTDEHLPTLRGVLSAMRGKLILCLDAKDNLHDRVVALVIEMGMLDDVLLLWLAPADQQLLRATRPERLLIKPTVYARPEQSDHETLDDYLKLKPAALTLNWKKEAYFREAAARLSALGIRVWATTLKPEDDNEQTWARVLAMGANIIQTDQAARLMAFLQTRANRVSGD